MSIITKVTAARMPADHTRGPREARKPQSKHCKTGTPVNFDSAQPPPKLGHFSVTELEFSLFPLPNSSYIVRISEPTTVDAPRAHPLITAPGGPANQR